MIWVLLKGNGIGGCFEAMEDSVRVCYMACKYADGYAGYGYIVALYEFTSMSRFVSLVLAPG